MKNRLSFWSAAEASLMSLFEINSSSKEASFGRDFYCRYCWTSGTAYLKMSVQCNMEWGDTHYRLVALDLLEINVHVLSSRLKSYCERRSRVTNIYLSLVVFFVGILLVIIHLMIQWNMSTLSNVKGAKTRSKLARVNIKLQYGLSELKVLKMTYTISWTKERHTRALQKFLVMKIFREYLLPY